MLSDSLYINTFCIRYKEFQELRMLCMRIKYFICELESQFQSSKDAYRFYLIQLPYLIDEKTESLLKKFFFSRALTWLVGKAILMGWPFHNNLGEGIQCFLRSSSLENLYLKIISGKGTISINILPLLTLSVKKLQASPLDLSRSLTILSVEIGNKAKVIDSLIQTLSITFITQLGILLPLP